MARLDELERKFEENPRRYFAPLANEYRKIGDAQRAAELCRSQLPEVPGHISGHIVLGQALYDARDFDGSRAALETALALDPENIVALRYLGDIARDTGDVLEAERWYSRTLEADPYNEAATNALQALRAAPARAGVSSPSEPQPATDSPATGFEPTSLAEPGPTASIEPAVTTDAAPPAEIADAGPPVGVAEIVSSEVPPDASRETRKALELALEEANRLRHEYVGTEHILLGLLREGEGVAATVLRNLNVDLEKIRQTIEETVKTGTAPQASNLPYTSRSKKVLELAMAEARELTHSHVGTEHLLLGLLREGMGIAGQVLFEAGVTLDAARAETLRALGIAMPDGGPVAEPLEQVIEVPTEPVTGTSMEAPETVEPALQAAPESDSPASGVLTVTGEFAGDLSVSAGPESTEPAVDEPSAAPGAPEPAVDEPSAAPDAPEPVVDEPSAVPEAIELVRDTPAATAEPERFDVAAHAPPEPETLEEAIQAEERVLASAAPFVTETMADLYLEQGYPHEALELLLQLSEQRPHDEELRGKIEHIEAVIVARREAAVAAARAERAEMAEAEAAAEAPAEAAAEAPAAAALSVRDLFARMDRARPRAASPVTPRPISRRRSDFVPMPEAEAAGSGESDDPFAFPSPPAPSPVTRTSGPQQKFNPATANSDEFDAWLRGLRGP